MLQEKITNQPYEAFKGEKREKLTYLVLKNHKIIHLIFF